MTFTPKSIYLASPYGFSEHQSSVLLPAYVTALESMGLEVQEPFAANNERGLTPHGIAKDNLWDVRNCDGIFAILTGEPPDVGVMFELGAAAALGKKAFLFRDDVRRCTDSGGDFPINLMAMAGYSSHSKAIDHLYTSIDDLADKDRVLWQWARGGKWDE